MEKKIVIVGGGIGGMTCALALARSNISSIVLESAPYFRETGAGIQLCPNVFRCFSHLGITESIKKIAVFPDNLVYLDGITGERFLNISLGEPLLERFHHPYGVFHREELLHALVAECEKSPLISLVTDAKVTGILEERDAVIACTEKGERFTGDALIGCDGLWSTVRRHIFGHEAAHFSGHIAHRGVVQIDKIAPHLRPNNVVHWVRDDAHLVHYPIGSQGLFNIIAIYQTKKDEIDLDDTNGDPDELKVRFEDSCFEILELLKHVSTSRKWLLFDRDPIACWSRGKITLLGDAAHPTLPYLTQGAGMAVEDACLIAKKIVQFDFDYAQAFGAYEKERHLRTAYVQLFSRAYGASHHSSGVARELRDFLVAKRSDEENYHWLSTMYNGIEL